LLIPIMRIISLSFPFQNNYIYNLTLTYAIFGLMSLSYLINYKVSFTEIGHNFKNIIYFIPGLAIVLLIAYFNHKYLPSQVFHNYGFKFYILKIKKYLYQFCLVIYFILNTIHLTTIVWFMTSVVTKKFINFTGIQYYA